MSPNSIGDGAAFLLIKRSASRARSGWPPAPAREAGAAAWAGAAVRGALLLPHRLVALDLVVAVGLDRDPDQHRQEVQLLAVRDLELADRVADGAERALRDLLGGRVRVDEVQLVRDVPALERALQHLLVQPEQLARAGLGDPHLGLHDLDLVVAGRQGIERGVGLDAGGVEGSTKLRHGYISS